MLTEDKILDIRDNLSSVLFCIDNRVGNEEIDRQELLSSIDSIKKSIVDDIDRLRNGESFELIKSKRIEDIVKGRLSSRVSLLYRVNELRDKLTLEGDIVKVSQNVINNLR